MDSTADNKPFELSQRFLVGGFIVSVFAGAGDALRPKGFAALLVAFCYCDECYAISLNKERLIKPTFYCGSELSLRPERRIKGRITYHPTTASMTPAHADTNRIHIIQIVSA